MVSEIFNQERFNIAEQNKRDTIFQNSKNWISILNTLPVWIFFCLSSLPLSHLFKDFFFY